MAKEKKTPIAQLYARVGKSINAHNGSFNHNYYIIKAPAGEREILKEIEPGTKVVAHHSRAGLASDILLHCREKLSAKTGYDTFTSKQAFEAGMDWVLTSPPIDTPALVLNRSDMGICYHRLPFDPDIHQSTPLFDEFMGRCSDPLAVKCFIGSLFYEDSDRQQYVWFWGDGQNGKGAIQRFLGKLLGPAYSSNAVPAKNGGGKQFWTSSLLGKRLVVFADCTEPEFPVTGLFKMLTGGDMVPIEKKKDHAFSAYLGCKFIFSSNERPMLTGQKSDVRRAIYIELKPISGEPEPEKVYDARLWAEAAGVVAKCKQLYLDYCGDGGSIPIDSTCMTDLIEANDEQWQAVFDLYFDEDSIEDIDEGNDKKPHFTGTDLITLFDALYKHQANKQAKAFRKWLRVSKGITRRSVTFTYPGRPPYTKGYVGARRNTVWPYTPRQSESSGKNCAKESGKKNGR